MTVNSDAINKLADQLFQLLNKGKPTVTQQQYKLKLTIGSQSSIIPLLRSTTTRNSVKGYR